MIRAIPPCSRISERNQAAGSATSVRSYTEKRIVSRTGNQRRVVEKAPFLEKKTETSGLRFSRSCAAAKINNTEEQKFYDDESVSSVHARRVTFYKNVGKRPSLGVIQPSYLHERNFFAPKFEDRTLEDTLAKERWARRAAWDLSKNVHKLRGNLDENRATFFSPSEVWCLPTPSTIKPQRSEFVVDSRASMHTPSKKDLDSEELETTVRVPRNP